MSTATAAARQGAKGPIIEHLEGLLQLTYELETSLAHFEADDEKGIKAMRDLMERRMLEYSQKVKQLGEFAPMCEDRIPVELLQFVDDGGHPDVFTRNVFEACLKDNQASKGKVVALRSLRDQLLQQAEQLFPEEASMYKAAVDRVNAPGAD